MLQPGRLPLSRPNFAGSVAEFRGTIGSIKAFFHHRAKKKKSGAQYLMTTKDSSQQSYKSVTIPIYLFHRTEVQYMQMVRVSSVSIVTGLRPARAGYPGSIESTGRAFSTFHSIHTALGPTQPLSGNPPPVVKLLGFEGNHSPEFST